MRQTTLPNNNPPVGYCELTGQISFDLEPGDDCPLCSEPLTTLPDR